MISLFILNVNKPFVSLCFDYDFVEKKLNILQSLILVLFVYLNIGLGIKWICPSYGYILHFPNKDLFQASTGFQKRLLSNKCRFLNKKLFFKIDSFQVNVISEHGLVFEQRLL